MISTDSKAILNNVLFDDRGHMGRALDNLQGSSYLRPRYVDIVAMQ